MTNLSRNSTYVNQFVTDQWNAFGYYNRGFTVTSSNPKVASFTALENAGYISDYGLTYYDVVFATGNQKGSTTFTVKATDGSNKSFSFKVTVR